jgi:hypothetical protein
VGVRTASVAGERELVASGLARHLDRPAHQRFADALPSLRRVHHHVLDNRVRPPDVAEVGHEDERGSAHDAPVFDSDEKRLARVGLDGIEGGFVGGECAGVLTRFVQG